MTSTARRGKMATPAVLRGLAAAAAALLLLLCDSQGAAAAAADPVVTLTDADFEDGKMAATEFALVEFFAPWCGHCKKLEPEFHAAAEHLRAYEPRVVFAAVDATAEKVESSRQAVRGFPTLKWYVRGVAVDYTGERNTRAIVNWVKKKTGLPAAELATAEDVDAFIRKHRVGVVACVGGPTADQDLEAFFAAARGLDTVPFAFSRAVELRPALVAAAATVAGGAGGEEDAAAAKSSALVVFKRPTAGFTHNSTAFTGTFTEPGVSRFVRVELLPRVVEFSEAGMSDIFNGFVQTQLVFFGHFGDDVHAELFDQLALRYRGDFVVVTVGPSEFRAMDFFDVVPTDLPTMRLLDLRTEPMYKYRYEDPIELDAVVAFVDKFQRGQLVPILKSAPVPPGPAAGPGEVVTVVGQTFDELVLQSGKWVLLQVYAPWCGHCKLLEPVWAELALARARDARVAVAQIDGTANEHLRLSFVGFPAIQLWAPGGKEVTAYKSHRTLKDLTAFLDKMLGPAPAPEAGGEEEAEVAEGHEEL